jgi:hypothetical protein
MNRRQFLMFTVGMAAAAVVTPSCAPARPRDEGIDQEPEPKPEIASKTQEELTRESLRVFSERVIRPAMSQLVEHRHQLYY